MLQAFFFTLVLLHFTCS